MASYITYANFVASLPAYNSNNIFFKYLDKNNGICGIDSCRCGCASITSCGKKFKKGININDISCCDTICQLTHMQFFDISHVFKSCKYDNHAKIAILKLCTDSKILIGADGTRFFTDKFDIIDIVSIEEFTIPDEYANIYKQLVFDVPSCASLIKNKELAQNLCNDLLMKMSKILCAYLTNLLHMTCVSLHLLLNITLKCVCSSMYQQNI